MGGPHGQGPERAHRGGTLMGQHARPRRPHSSREKRSSSDRKEGSPDGTLPGEERRQRAEHAKRAFMLRPGSPGHAGKQDAL